jgi:hypothetical protein
MLTQPPDLFAVHVAEDDIADYCVREAGWYAADERERIVLGPFASLDECEGEIRQRGSLLH